jgi:hypothetical protein
MREARASVAHPIFPGANNSQCEYGSTRPSFQRAQCGFCSPLRLKCDCFYLAERSRANPSRLAGSNPAMTSVFRALRLPLSRSDTDTPRILFIIFVDRMFTTLFEWPFTNVFDVIGQSPAISCLCRAGNAD